MWLEWLKDEINLHEDSNGSEQLTALFETALTDYHYRKVYKLYLRHLIGSKQAGKSDVFERAVRIWGLEIDKGDAMWQLFADYCLEHEP